MKAAALELQQMQQRGSQGCRGAEHQDGALDAAGRDLLFQPSRLPALRTLLAVGEYRSG